MDPLPVSVFTPSPGVQLSPSVLKAMFDSLEKPLVVKGQLRPWMDARSWRAVDLCSVLHKTTTFKVCPKESSKVWNIQFKKSEVVFETQCKYVETTFENFVKWLSMQSNLDDMPSKKFRAEESKEHSTPNPLLQYSSSDYWVYADYKYMCCLCSDQPEILSAINWSLFGFDGCDGKDSTLWIGSEGSYTPCHYDTYGCNIVAQLAGEKKWTLFSPQESECMYPTRVPYEESSVFSRVNVMNPDLVKYPLFQHATPFTAVLHPGEVLFVPKHWWHYVQSAGSAPTVSVNMWIKKRTFATERVKEAVTRLLVSQFTVALPELLQAPDWINPNEVIFSTHENLRLLSEMLQHWHYNVRNKTNSCEVPSTETKLVGDKSKDTAQSTLSVQDFIKAITDDKVVTLISELLQKECLNKT